MLKTLLTLLTLSITIGDRVKIVYDKCDYAEINTMYDDNGEPELRQIIFWEWRKGQRENKKTGVTNYVWGYGVKGWKRVGMERERDSRFSNESLPAKSTTGWYSTWIEDKYSKNAHVYVIRYRYLIQTHTTYDPEIENKKFVPNALRTGFR